jgi:hypothetical protein
MHTTISDFVSKAVSNCTVEDLQNALQAAIELELSTLPPYLCAKWSVKNQNDPVAQLINSVVLEEMEHLGLACNLLVAIGGKPVINTSTMPTYPGNLPGGVLPDLTVYLAGLTQNYVKDVYMNIEYPEGDPVDPADRSLPAETPPTIGTFYAQILAVFQNLYDSTIIFDTKNQNTSNVGHAPAVFLIQRLADVEEAISEITEQGEGTSTSPDTDPQFGVELAHYYRFGEIYHGQILAQAGDGTWGYTGPAIPFPTDIYPMAQIPAGGYHNPSPEAATALNAFNAAFSQMISDLQYAWNDGGSASLSNAIDGMFNLQDLAIAIMAISLPDGSGNVYGPNFIVKDVPPTSTKTSTGTSTSGSVPSFKTDILPIFQPYAGDMEGILDITDYQTVSDNATEIYARLTSTDPDTVMPCTGPLPANQMAAFKAWMDGGKLP